jgi:hypothetical protein
VFLTPEQLPFYGGTYFPPDARHGMPAWTQVLQAIAESWQENRDEIRAGGERLRERLSGGASLTASGEPLQEPALDRAVATLAESFDARHGGFGSGAGGPRFPQAPVLELLLLRENGRTMALTTLHAMAGGGIHDQIGGGFARYSVDAGWTVPHFEKMLYDNALLARAYLHGWQASRDERLREVCVDTLEWVLREMRGPEGGFYSALDADSDGLEGRFYVWTPAELRDALGEDTDTAIAWLGVTEQGNFQDPHHPQPGWNVLTDRAGTGAPDPETRARIRERLLASRELRERPSLDDKRLTSWNALMVSALADAGAALGEQRYTDAAVSCAEFLQTTMRKRSPTPAGERGRLLRTYNHGQAKIDAYLEDHAFLLEALIALFEATCEERWFHEAVSVADEIVERFADPEKGGFFSTASDQEPLIARRKDLEDTPIPSGASSAALGLLRLAQLTGESDYERHAVSVLRLLHEIAPRHPTAFGHLLQALHWHLSPARPIACPVPQTPRA